MEVLVNVEGIVGFIEGAVARLAAQPALDLRHQWEEVSRVARVEGLSEFGQDDLAPLRHFGGDDAGSIPPVRVCFRSFIALSVIVKLTLNIDN